jgi:hypothetical protein
LLIVEWAVTRRTSRSVVLGGQTSDSETSVVVRQNAHFRAFAGSHDRVIDSIDQNVNSAGTHQQSWKGDNAMDNALSGIRVIEMIESFELP